MKKRNLTIQARLYISFSDQIKLFYQEERKKLSGLSLKTSQARLLHFLSDYDGLNQQEACNAYGIGSSTMSELLTSLEQESLIYREINQENKRMTFIHLTDKGEQTAKEIHRLFDEYCLKYMEEFSDEEIMLFENLLSRFSK